MDIKRLEWFLTVMMKSAKGVSDLNFTVGRPPQVEADGELRAVGVDGFPRILAADDTDEIAKALIGGNKRALAQLKQSGACDFSYGLHKVRLRCNIFTARGRRSIVLRVLPSDVPNLDQLQLPSQVGEAADYHDGLIFVTGATGAGKTTTLAAIIDRINENRPVHIVTLEDPVEYVHAHKLATVNQRELGTDFRAYSDGLRAALRQAPKVILVGEVRDRETIEVALKAAETGHLILASLHTNDSGQTVNRLLGLFDSSEQRLIRSRLSQSLRAAIGQRLVPRIGGGRLAALEIMKSDLAIRELITNGETIEKSFYDIVASSRSKGMQTYDQHLLELYEAGFITEDTAKQYCSDLAIMGVSIDRVHASQGLETSDLGRLSMAAIRDQQPGLGDENI